MPFQMLAPFLASMGSGIMNKLTGSTPTDGTQITGAGNDAASGDLGGGMGSIIGGMGKDMLGGISTGLTNQVTDKLFGSSADKDKEALDKLYPGTSAWDRLNGGGGGVTTPAGGSAVQKQQMSIPEKVAKIQANAANRTARATEYSADTHKAASEYSADKAYKAEELRSQKIGWGPFSGNIRALIGENHEDDAWSNRSSAGSSGITGTDSPWFYPKKK